MRVLKCKQCDTRMWEDEGEVWCPNCGWSPHMPIEDEESPEGEY